MRRGVGPDGAAGAAGIAGIAGIGCLCAAACSGVALDAGCLQPELPSLTPPGVLLQTPAAPTTTHSTAWPARLALEQAHTTGPHCACTACTSASCAPGHLLSLACITACTACPCLQYGHLLNSRFSDSEWGVYLKGGSGEALYCPVYRLQLPALLAGGASPPPVVADPLPFRLCPFPTSHPPPFPACSIFHRRGQRVPSLRHHRLCRGAGHWI